MLYFVHGLNGTYKSWKSFVDFFSKQGFECQAVDLRKGLDLKNTGLRDYVDKVEEMVCSDDVLVGHSMGGLIVQKVCEEKNLRAGIGVCPAPPSDIKFRIFSIGHLKYIPHILLKRPFKPSYSIFKKLIFNCLSDREARKAYEMAEKESTMVTLDVVFQRMSVDETKVDCPLFFIAAEDDRSVPPSLVKQIAGKYDAEYRVYKGCHYVFSDWKKFAEGILDFINCLD